MFALYFASMNPSFNHSAFETLCATESFDHSRYDQAHNLPIVSSSTFVYESPKRAMEFFAGKREHMNIYSRWSNPTVMALEEKLAKIEVFGLNQNATCYCFSSGMAAISAALMAHLQSGDKLVTQGNLYGTTTELFQTTFVKQGIEPIEIDCKDLALFEQSVKDEKVKAVYLESPSNPTMACVDIEQIAAIAHQNQCIVYIDNTFNTAYVQQPLALGVDVVLHSTTKFLNGHGSALGGAVISSNNEFMKQVWKVRKTLGHTASPFDAWLTYNGIKTLPLRMRKHISNAEKIANFLLIHPAVERVNYLGLEDHPDHGLAKKQMHHFGSIISFELKGGINAGETLMDSIQLLTLTASLGTTDTLISHPASMTHAVVPKAQREQFGITDGMIRLSVGLEGADDIIADLERGL